MENSPFHLVFEKTEADKKLTVYLFLIRVHFYNSTYIPGWKFTFINTKREKIIVPSGDPVEIKVSTYYKFKNVGHEPFLTLNIIY